MALVPIVLGAGGQMTDWEGEPLKFVVKKKEATGVFPRWSAKQLNAGRRRAWRV